MEDLTARTEEELRQRRASLAKLVIDKKITLAALSAEMASNFEESKKSVALFCESQKKALSAEGYKAFCAREALCKKNHTFRRCLIGFSEWLGCFLVLFGLTVGFKGVLTRVFPFGEPLLFSLCAVLEIVLSLLVMKAWGNPSRKRLQEISRMPEIKQLDKSVSRFKSDAAKAVAKKNEGIKARKAQMESAIEQAQRQMDEIEDRLVSLKHPNTVYVFFSHTASRYSIYLDGALYQRIDGAQVFVASVKAGTHSLRVEEECVAKRSREKTQNGVLVFLADEDAHFFVVNDALEETSVSKLVESANTKIKGFSIE